MNKIKAAILSLLMAVGMVLVGAGEAQAAGYTVHNNYASVRDQVVKKTNGTLAYVYPGGNAYNGVQWRVYAGYCVDFGYLNGAYVGTKRGPATGYYAYTLTTNIWTKVFRC